MRNIVPDPKKWKVVKTIFEEYSTGTHGLVSISRRLLELGIKSGNGKPWSKDSVRWFLSNRIYIGVMEWKGETYEGKYKTFISRELFDKVQKVLKNRCKPRRVRNGHHFPFCGLFHCTCGSMMSAQWAKGNGGLYRYYRCTRKAGDCAEPYVQEKAVVDRCLAILKPLAVSPEQANHLRALVDEETRKDGEAVETAIKRVSDRLSSVQEKLNRLTRGYLDELIDEESYQSAKTDLVMEKSALKEEKQRLQRTGSVFWNEPAKQVINAF
ncbi:MAG: recombinase family protein, partial [Verrucomicrobiota bacterium]|nr:recombinase family protein [Verrucomicrobiota bacterium]